ncbi:hypothetical protein FRB95_011202 [Tulasnella sp. JGI-2019a]|nr:hypothetical protein FRB95_011202 [Tulasnella sp. JGI-2019a]
MDEQICNGIYAGTNSYINVSFDSSSQGQVAMVIYEWADSNYLGAVTPGSDTSLPRTYICTTDAVRAGLCAASDVGMFILDLPANKTVAETSIWGSSIAFSGTPSAPASLTQSNSSVSSSTRASFWDNPDGPPTPPADPSLDDYTSPWLARRALTQRAPEDTMPTTPMTGATIQYIQPIHYHVNKTGYYCVGAIPVTVLHQGETGGTNHTHASFSGTVLFQNEFWGQLPAAEYPKITFYMIVMLAYTGFAAGWAFLCLRHRHDLLPIQNYVSALFGLVVVEMLANWAYYRYVNAHGDGTASKVFLFVVSILDAARNSLSFFLLLIVSLGLGVVREEIDAMNKARILAAAHAFFGVVYAVGMDLVQLETASAFLLLLCVVPLAVTMTVFLLWIMYGLTGTIAELAARKQKYKLGMFKKLYRVLIAAVVALFIFFITSSMSFSSRYEEDYTPRSWKNRWWLLDGWLVLLYMAVFVTIAFFWRPTGSNRRLAMSDELAQDEEDAEDYDLEAIQMRGDRAKMEAMMGIDDMGAGGGPQEGRIALRGDDGDDDGDTVFEIGDEGSDDEGDRRKSREAIVPAKDRTD